MFREMFRFVAHGALEVVDVRARIVAELEPEAPAWKPAPVKNWTPPPGAAPNFATLCSQCDDCIRACPHFVLRKAGPECGDAIAGRPIVIPADNPCLLCDGLPCIDVCKTGALVMPAPGERARLGVARVDTETCYSAQRQPCDYCTTHCPERPKAITVDGPGHAAAVLEDACTGCGKCAHLCPGGAISIQPMTADGGRS